MEAILQDIRFARCMLARSPWFSAVIVLVMAIGIGATTAVFSVVDRLLLKPLPYTAAERVVMVLPQGKRFTPRDFHAITEGSRSFEALAARSGFLFNLLEGDAPERVWSFKVSPAYFHVLDGAPLLGRTFSPEEGAAGADQVAVLSYGLWQRRFGADPRIIGRTINLSGKPFTVIGVMPKHRVDSGFPAIWTPSYHDDQQERTALVIVGRLKAGVDAAAASAEVLAIRRRLAAEVGDSAEGVRAHVLPVREAWTGDIRPTALMLLAATATLLLIACANVANLLLSRATSRQAEIAIRAALGATPGRIVRQLLTESAVLGLVSGALGLLLAMWGVDLLIAGLGWNIPHAELAGVDGRALAFTLLVSLAAALGFGLAPALEASRRDVHGAMKEGGMRATASGQKSLSRSALVVVEIALALALVAGAGVLAKSFARLAARDPGFDPRGVSVFQVQLWSARHESPEAQRRFSEAALEKIRALPGVTGAAVASDLPMSFSNSRGHRVETEGRAPWPKDGAPDVERRCTSPSYLSTLGIPLREGRFFDENDRATTARVAVVNETMARRFWPGERPIGKRILLDDKPEAIEVVGVIADVHTWDMREEELIPEVVLPISQNPDRWMMFAVRASGAPAALRASVRAAMRDVDPEQPFADIQNANDFFTTLEETVAWGLSLPRFCAALLGLFAAMALGLAAVGVFGVTAYAVEQRTREIGVRMALGAQPGDVIRLVLKQSAVLTLIGVGVGLPVALFATRALRALVYGVSPADPASLAGAAALLAVVTLVASYLPARRATRISPMLALRAD